jgi:hypothetical protein
MMGGLHKSLLSLGNRRLGMGGLFLKPPAGVLLPSKLDRNRYRGRLGGSSLVRLLGRIKML